MVEPFVGIITINFNQSEFTTQCVESVLKSNYLNYKIILIDNGSEIEDFDQLRKISDRRIILKRIEKNCGYVGAINIGLEIGSSHDVDYFVIMNNDTVIDENAVANLIHTSVRHNNKAIVSGKVYHYDDPNRIQYAGSYFSDRRFLTEYYPGKDEEDIGQIDDELNRDMLDDILWVIPKEIKDSVGMYSDNFFLYGEQADYALRAVQKGYNLIYSPDVKIWHKGSITTGGGNRYSPPVNFWRKKSGVIYLYRHTAKRYVFVNLIRILSKSSLKVLLNSIGLRKSEDKMVDYSGLVGTLYGIKWIIFQKPDNGYNPFLNKS